jgi:hypothetical protein
VLLARRRRAALHQRNHTATRALSAANPLLGTALLCEQLGAAFRLSQAGNTELLARANVPHVNRLLAMREPAVVEPAVNELAGDKQLSSCKAEQDIELVTFDVRTVAYTEVHDAMSVPASPVEADKRVRLVWIIDEGKNSIVQGHVNAIGADTASIKAQVTSKRSKFIQSVEHRYPRPERLSGLLCVPNGPGVQLQGPPRALTSSIAAARCLRATCTQTPRCVPPRSPSCTAGLVGCNPWLGGVRTKHIDVRDASIHVVREDFGPGDTAPGVCFERHAR